MNDAQIEHKGLFLNADSVFNSKKCRDIPEKKMTSNIKENPLDGDAKQERYFDPALYERRFKIEKADAWLDSFKALLVRFEKTNKTWMSLQYLTFYYFTPQKNRSLNRVVIYIYNSGNNKIILLRKINYMF